MERVLRAEATSDVTQFIESFATKQLLPPWEAYRARTWSFAIRMSEARIRAHLERYFNGRYGDRAPYAYEPLPGPQFGLVSICRFPNIKSLYPGQGSGSDGAPWDRISHTEVYLAFPVYRYAVTEDRLMTDRTLVWVEPVIYSDNDSIVFSSREIWGSDMFLATIEHDDKLTGDDIHFDAGMIGIKTFSPRSVDQLLAILHVRAGSPRRVALPKVLRAKPDLQEFVNILGGSGRFADGHLPKGAQTSRYPEGVEVNNVKQFRDCYDMATAIYRGIVASQTSYANVTNIVFYDASNIEIAFMWSDSQAEFLTTLLDASAPTDPGPPPEHAGGPKPCPPDQMDWDMDRVVIKAEFGFAYTADISFSVLSTLHTYGTSA